MELLLKEREEPINDKVYLLGISNENEKRIEKNFIMLDYRY